jgi:hypothetical protein
VENYDLLLSHDECKSMIQTIGWDGFFELFSALYPDRKFFSCSRGWYDESKFVCKFKGTFGDLVIGWQSGHKEVDI